MVEKKSDCKLCTHVKVCRVKEDYESAYLEASHMNVEESFRLSIECKFYERPASVGCTQVYRG